jgi:hypothetical protein
MRRDEKIIEQKLELKKSRIKDQKIVNHKQCTKCKQKYPASSNFFYRKQKNKSVFDS